MAVERGGRSLVIFEAIAAIAAHWAAAPVPVHYKGAPASGCSWTLEQHKVTEVN